MVNGYYQYLVIYNGTVLKYKRGGDFPDGSIPVYPDLTVRGGN